MTSATFTPALMGESDAAFYIGISPTALRGTNIPRRKFGRRRLYDRRDLDAWRDGPPYEGEDNAVNTCDAAFG